MFLFVLTLFCQLWGHHVYVCYGQMMGANKPSRVSVPWIFVLLICNNWNKRLFEFEFEFESKRGWYFRGRQSCLHRHLITPSMSLEFRKVTKLLGMGLKVVYGDVLSRKKASDRTMPWWVAVILRKFVRTLRRPQLNYVKVARMAPSQLTDKPVSWQDSRSWSSQVQDHGSQGSMSVLNQSVRISVCNFVK